MKEYRFQKAIPVWQPGKDREMNYNLIFRTVVDRSEHTVVNISASNTYQMFINGDMVADGPARAGHNIYRVDEIDVSKYLSRDKNIISIIVDSYYVKNYYLIGMPGFLCAEVVEDGRVVCATGVNGFDAMYHSGRLRFVDRYSYQRTFTEAYRIGEDYDDFKTKLECAFEPIELAPVGERRFIERGVPYPCYDEHEARGVISEGEFTYLSEPEEYNTRRWLSLDVDNVGQGYTRDEAELYVIDEMDKCKCTAPIASTRSARDSEICAHGYAIYDLGLEKTGFIMLDVLCEQDTEIITSYDEVLVDGDVSTSRYNVSNGIVWYLKRGSYKLISNEPSSQRYIKLSNNSDGKIVVKRLAVKAFEFDYKSRGLGSSNEKLNLIYEAAIETFKQNTLDIYMDCPSRERAGWLCDSYFTSRVEHHLTGKSAVERNFLNNFVMAEGFGDIPENMFAMCYPADFTSHLYIPNWAMWYVIELDEYFERTSDRETVELAKEKIMKLYDYFEGLRNDDGLLENLDGWVFLEWSRANDFTQNVNYPSNMLYAKMLRSMARLYGGNYASEAEKIEQAILEQSYYDGFFHDHAVRLEDGRLEVCDADVTETCQYYAFFTELATPATHPELWGRLLNDFGPNRMERGLWTDIYPSNSFIGNYLRLCLLERYGQIEMLIDNIENYFYYMAERTGTLWEHINSGASCNHGFASLVAVWLDKYAKR